MKEHYDVIIVGTGAAGLYCALNLPEKMKILLITKQEADQSDSFLAQGGICMLRGEDDYENYFEDTMRAGHYENNKRAVDLMIRSSNDIIRDLLRYHVDFARDGLGNLAFTREGAHSQPRILFHEDITGKEITSKLLAQVKQLSSVTLLEYNNDDRYHCRKMMNAKESLHRIKTEMNSKSMQRIQSGASGGIGWTL